MLLLMTLLSIVCDPIAPPLVDSFFNTTFGSHSLQLRPLLEVMCTWLLVIFAPLLVQFEYSNLSPIVPCLHSVFSKHPCSLYKFSHTLLLESLYYPVSTIVITIFFLVSLSSSGVLGVMRASKSIMWVQKP
jgi:hypothetical protein